MGIFLLLLDQIKALQEMGHEVTAICAAGPWVKRIRQEGIKVETVKWVRELDPWNDLKALYALSRLFKNYRFDIVHTHTPKAGLLGPLAARLARIPLVVHTVHGFLFHDQMPVWKRRIFWLVEKITAVCSDYLLFQSSEDMDQANKTQISQFEKNIYLGNGIDVDKFSPVNGHRDSLSLRRQYGLKESDIVVGSVGRMVYEKGFAEFFAAAEELTAKHNNLKFIVVGPEDQEQSDRVRTGHIELLKQRKAVLLLGWQEHMPDWYSMMDIFVLPSHREGVPRACMEAAAMTRPVIATNIRGCREVVLDGRNGLLFPVKDTRALVTAIERLCKDKSERIKLGEEGRRHIVANFDSRQMIQRLCNFYTRMESLLNGKSRGPQ